MGQISGQERGPIALSGASGLVGTALRRSLASDGIEVRPLVRPGGHDEAGISWDPERGLIDLAALEGVRGVVHLAGESLAGRRWTKERRAKIFDSRARGTKLLAEALAGLRDAPDVLVSASAIGYYGARGDEPLDEDAAPGSGFLADVCKAWEAATSPADAAGIRVVRCRLGVVLSPEGGALAKMRLPFKLGVGGRLGDGQQYMSWISLPDVVAGLRRALFDPAIEGPVNLVAPGAVTNAELTRALGRALHRPTLVPVPRFALRGLLGGDMAEEMLLTGQRVVPAKLETAGFTFAHPDLDAALAYTEGAARGDDAR